MKSMFDNFGVFCESVSQNISLIQSGSFNTLQTKATFDNNWRKEDTPSYGIKINVKKQNTGQSYEVEISSSTGITANGFPAEIQAALLSDVKLIFRQLLSAETEQQIKKLVPKFLQHINVAVHSDMSNENIRENADMYLTSKFIFQDMSFFESKGFTIEIEEIEDVTTSDNLTLNSTREFIVKISKGSEDVQFNFALIDGDYTNSSTEVDVSYGDFEFCLKEAVHLSIFQQAKTDGVDLTLTKTAIAEVLGEYFSRLDFATEKVRKEKKEVLDILAKTVRLNSKYYVTGVAESLPDNKERYTISVGQTIKDTPVVLVFDLEEFRTQESSRYYLLSKITVSGLKDETLLPVLNSYINIVSQKLADKSFSGNDLVKLFDLCISLNN